MRFQISDFRFQAWAGRLISAAWLLSASVVSAKDTISTNLPVIDLPTALRLAGAQNLDVQLVREKLAEAQAQNESTTWEFFPWIAPGFAYRAHDGNLQETSGNILEVHRDSYEVGPVLVARVDLGDAIYKKLAARQLAKAASHEVESRRQQTILAAATGYFNLARAQASASVAREAVRVSTEYLEQIERAVEAGLAFKGDALRVRTQLERNRLSLRQTEEQRRLAGARLAETLRLDSTIELTAMDGEPSPLSLVPTNTALATLVNEALAARPELHQSQALVEAAQKTRDGAVYGPLVPSIGAQVFVGGMGGGNRTVHRGLGETEDYQVTLAWRIGPGGLFDRSRARAAEARLRSSRIVGDKQHDEIVREVVEGFTRVQSSVEQLETARRGLAAAEEAFLLARERREFGVGIVLETIQAEQELTRARMEFLRVVADHNAAQFHLRWAVGGSLLPPETQSAE